MSQRQKFQKEFNTLDYVLRNAQAILLMPHMNPDLDAVGSVVALYYFIRKHYDKNVSVVCYDPLPDSMKDLVSGITFVHPDSIDVSQFDVAIGCDSVERGFKKISSKLSDDCVSVIIDHHHDITMEADIRIIDGQYAATCEIIYYFSLHVGKPLDKRIATALLGGVIGDTGAFQHANTSADVLLVSAHLIKYGASITKIISTMFANRKIETLNLWGKALERTKFFESSGLAITAITEEGMGGQQINSAEFSTIASMLTTVPKVKAAMVVYQATPTTIKGSLRAEKHANIDVSSIAHTLGGGGHKLASGFSIAGRIETASDGSWKIV